jgi:hypothetical protein
VSGSEQFVGCGLWVVGCGLWVVGCGLWVVGCELWFVICDLRLVVCLEVSLDVDTGLLFKLLGKMRHQSPAQNANMNPKQALGY